MNSHYLDHIVVESTDNLHFVIVDSSSYNPDLELPVTYYDVYLPNFSNPVSIQYTPQQNTVVNSTVLGYTSFDNFNPLADGLWMITQKIVEGVSGETTVCYSSKNYFRVNNTKQIILNKINQALEDNDCDLLSKYKSWLHDLDLAKMMAENLCMATKAVVIFNAISEQLSPCQNCK